MRKVILILLFAISYSCASTSAEWSAWKPFTEAQEDQDWRFCNASKDGPELHRKGMCWQAQECRTKNPWYSGEKKECRRMTLFCKWGDVDCMDINGIFNKVIVDKEKLK